MITGRWKEDYKHFFVKVPYQNVHTDPNALAMPPKVEWKQMIGMAESMSKLMLGGKMDEVMDTIRSNYKHLVEVFD
jgi:pyruvate dehydrogenase (quinone)